MSDNQFPNVPPKPKRPFTVYNMFYILERNYEVQQHQKRAPVASNSPSDAQVDPYLSTRPERYRDLVLPYNWYIAGMNKVKRSKYKSHGVITFDELSKLVSDRWEKVDGETRQYLQKISDNEHERYKKEVAAFVERYGREAFEAQKTTYNKRPKKTATMNRITRNDDDEHVSDESEDGITFHCEFGSSSQLPGTMIQAMPARLDTNSAPIANPQLAETGVNAMQYDTFMAQLQQSESIENSRGQGFPDYLPYANPQLTEGNDFAQQFNPFRSQLQGSDRESINASHPMSRFDQMLSNDFPNTNSLLTVPAAGAIAQQYDASPWPDFFSNANPQPTGCDYFLQASTQISGTGVPAQQYHPFLSQWNGSEGQQKPGYLPHANPQPTGTSGSTIQQYVPSRAQLQQSKSIEYSHLVNRDGERLSDYLPDDRSEALALVDYDSDNILFGSELEKAFDSDDNDE